MPVGDDRWPLGRVHARVGFVVRVVIGDAAALAREALAALLVRHGLDVLACTGTVPELGRAITAGRPDLAVVDAGLPGAPSPGPPGPSGPPGPVPPADPRPVPPSRTGPFRTGPAGAGPAGSGAAGDRPALARLRARHPRVGLLVLADEPRVELARVLLGVGGAGLGFLIRDRVADVPALLDAARLVAAGGSAVDPEVVARLLTPDTGVLATLSARELDVLALLAEGRTNSAIAARLWLTSRTVEGHVRSIFGKLRLPATADDHRRVLAARAYLAAQTKGSAK